MTGGVNSTRVGLVVEGTAVVVVVVVMVVEGAVSVVVSFVSRILFA